MRKLLSTAVLIGVIGSASLTSSVMADISATTLPSLNSATNADVTRTDSTMNIQITGGQGSLGTLNWNSYNVGSDATVNYEFSAHNQTALNKVAATGGLSQIYGRITSSGCSGCGYEGTGKVILLNPNGVFFGTGANVDLNSFTVSTMDGVYNKDTKTLSLTRNTASPYGIIVQQGANIHGDKNVTFASDNVKIYNGSKISTDTIANVGDTAYGKIKIVTSDGVNFNYYNNGAVKSIDGIKTTADKMTINVNGELTSGHIDIRNYSSNADSEVNLNGAALKAVKAIKGNDGNIWLTASNQITVDNSTLETQNATGAASVAGGNISLIADKKASVKNSTLKSVGDIEVISNKADSVVDSSNLTADGDIRITAANIASAQNNSTLNAKNITINGGKRAQAVSSNLTASNDVNLISAGDLVWTNGATINAGRDVNATATNGYIYAQNSNYNATRNVNLTSKDSITSARLAGTTFKAGNNVNVKSTDESILLTGTEQFQPTGKLNLDAKKHIEIKKSDDLTTQNVNLKAGENVYLTSTEGNVNVKNTTTFESAKKIYISGAKNVTTTNTVDMNNIQTNINAGNNINVKLSNVGNRQNGVIAQAGDNLTIETPGTLSVSSLISGKDMKIKANRVIAGLPYTTEQKLNNDYERSYIEVGGEFTSEVTNDNYDVTLSGDPTPDYVYNRRHHIQYGEDEKILLVNKRLRPADPTTEPTIPGINDGADVDPVNPTATPTTPTVEPTVPTVTPTTPTVTPTTPTVTPTNPTVTPTNPTVTPTNPTVTPTDPTVDPCDGDPALDDQIIDETQPGASGNGLNASLLNVAQSASTSSNDNQKQI